MKPGGSDALVFFVGAALIVANELFDGDMAELWALITKGTQPTNFPSRGMTVLGEAVFLVILLVFAKISPGSSKFVLTLLFILWFVWTMKHPDLLAQISATFAQKQAPNQNVIAGPGGVYTSKVVK